MITNYEKIKEMVNDENKLIEWLDMNNLPDKDLGICDTDKCPYLDICHDDSDENNHRCKLSNEEELKIWLHMEAK